MDSAVNSPKINLLTAKFSSVRAEIGEKGDASGGTLHVSIKTKLAKNGKSSQALGQVFLSVVALPKGSDPEDKKAFAFKVDLAVDGIFEWAKGEEPNLADDSIEYPLLQSLYITAVNEVVALSQKLGFPGIELPLELKQNKKLSAKKGPKKPSSAKATSSSSRRK